MLDEIGFYALTDERARRVAVQPRPPLSRAEILLDDMAVMGDKHYPCIIYLREGGQPIGGVSPDRRDERRAWYEARQSDCDLICSRNCLDFCVAHNNRVAEMMPAG